MQPPSLENSRGVHHGFCVGDSCVSAVASDFGNGHATTQTILHLTLWKIGNGHATTQPSDAAHPCMIELSCFARVSC
eukprot:6110058-Amphidinium_carterae.1